MSHAIYLSSKSSNTPTVIYVRVNQHNSAGWVEKTNGQAIKLFKKLISR